MKYDFKQVWQIKKPQYDYLGNRITSGLQYTIQLKTGEVIASKSLKDAKHKDDTEFIDFDDKGNLMWAFVVKNGGHGGSFWYDEYEKLLYTQVTDDQGQHYFGRLSFDKGINKEYELGDFIQPLTKIPSYLRFNFQNRQVNKAYDWVASDIKGNLYLGLRSDLYKGNFKPLKTFNLNDCQLTPTLKDASDGTTNTIQANALAYPYVFITSGDENNKDPRLITCIHAETGQVIFQDQLNLTSDIKLPKHKLNDSFRFEPEGAYWNLANQSLMVGFNRSQAPFLSSLFGYACRSALYETKKYNRYLPALIN